MSENILERAKATLAGWNLQVKYAGRDWEPVQPTEYQAVQLLPELIAEVERLRSHHIQIMGKIRAWILNDCAEVCRGFDWRDEEISRQREEIAAKDARIKELEAIVDFKSNSAEHWYKEYMTVYKIKRTADNDRLTRILEEKEAYIERLEAAFLESLAARLYYEHYPGVSDAYSWHDYPEDACHSMPKEEFRKKAREALARIKEGKG